MASSAAASAASSAAVSAAATATPEVVEKSENQTTEDDSEYGKVKIPVVEVPHMTKTIEGLHDNSNLDMCCGIVGSTISVVVAVIAFIFAFSALNGKYTFFELPELRKLAKTV